MTHDFACSCIYRFEEPVARVDTFHLQEPRTTPDTARWLMVIGKDGINVRLIVSKGVRNDGEDAVEISLVAEFYRYYHGQCLLVPRDAQGMLFRGSGIERPDVSA